MLRNMWSSLIAVFRKPVFGTIVVPPDATVDPALFPGDEYPVYCAKCGYDLRMLPDGKCPECGTDFTRGQLLVKTYLHRWSGALWRRSTARKWSVGLLRVGAGANLASLLGLSCLAWVVNHRAASYPPTKTIDSVIDVVRILLGLILVGAFFTLAALVIFIRSYPRGTWKRRRAIIDAIKQARGQDE